MRERVLTSVATRVLGVGLTASLAAVTLVLAATDRLSLYVNPDSAWFAVSMAVLALVGTVASFALPLGAEADHGHDHGHDHSHDHAPRPALGGIAIATGGVLATGIVGAMLVVPPATLSAELAMSRDTGAPPLFQGADNVALAVTGDTASFGVGEWASVFATATNPEAFDGDEVSLTGFVTPAADGEGFSLTRLVITHCVIDAQPASIPVSGTDAPRTGEWVTITGTIRDVAGRLQIRATSVETIAEPAEPYEY